MNIIVTGSLGFDYIMEYNGLFSDDILINHTDKLSLSFTVNSLMSKSIAGCGGNIAYTLSLFGMESNIVGVAGADYEFVKEYYEKLKINTHDIKIYKDELSTQLFVTTDINNNQLASCYLGAMKYAQNLSLKHLIKNKDSLVIISPNSSEAMKKFIQECITLDRNYIYAPGQQIINLSKEEILKGISSSKAFIINEYELEIINNKIKITLDELLKISNIFVVTLGGKGSIIYKENKKTRIYSVSPSFIKDPTGCGDAYVAAFTVGLINKFPLEIIGNIASLAATYVLENKGTQKHLFTKDSFIERYNKNFGVPLDKF